MGEFVLRHIKFMHAFFRNTQFYYPIFYFLSPIFKLFLPFFFFFGRLYKIFYFHLFKFSRPKHEVLRRNLVAKSFAYLRHAKRKFRMKRIYDIFEVYKHALSSFRPQINFAGGIIHRTGVGFKHHIKMFFLRELSAAIWTFIARQMIRPKSFMAFFTLHQWVVKT